MCGRDCSVCVCVCVCAHTHQVHMHVHQWRLVRRGRLIVIIGVDGIKWNTFPCDAFYYIHSIPAITMIRPPLTSLHWCACIHVYLLYLRVCLSRPWDWCSAAQISDVQAFSPADHDSLGKDEHGPCLTRWVLQRPPRLSTQVWSNRGVMLPLF